MNNITLATIHDTVNDLQNITNINMNEIIKFAKCELTEKTANNYLNLMNELYEKIEKLDTSLEQKNQFKSLFVLLFTKMAESDCKSEILNDVIIKNKKYKLMLEQLQKDWQNDRNEFNILAKKYNEKQKESKINLPGLSLSLTLKQEKKILNTDEILKFVEESNIDEKEIADKFKRISIPKEYKNKVSRAYVKSSDNGNNTFQK